VLISSSLLTSASWQTAPNLNSHQVAQSVHSENGSASTAQPANSPAAQSTEHTASDQAQQKDATGAEVPHTASRRGAIKIQDSHTADTSTTDSQALAGNMPQMPFQAVLSDVLPQLEPGVAAQFAKQAANELSDGQLGQDLGKAVADTLLHGKTGIETRAAALAPAIQIAKQTGTPNDLSQKLADGETAFAARVVQRAGVAATVALRDAQSVISSSRFDAPKNGAGADAETQGAITVKKSDAPASQTKAPAEQAAQPAAGSQLAGDASSNQDGDAQRDTSEGDAAGDLRAAAGGAQEAPTTVQPAQANITGTGTMPAVPLETHNAVAAKATPEPGAPQLLEPQGDNANRTGESVRNISLRLSSADQGSVQVRLSERAGELHVSVRTPDTGLTRGLRDGLPDLMGRLQVNGYRAETWQPGGNGSNAGQDHGHDAPGHGNSQQRNGGGQQQNSQDQQQDEPTPQWVRELETSIQRSNS
jgi:hypothetical protein